MHKTIRHKEFKKTFGVFIIIAIALLFMAGPGFCQSEAQTVDEKYPGLVSAILKNARLAPMDKQILLKEVFRHTGFLAKDKVYSKLAEMGVGQQQQSEAVFARGSGPVEVILFTDYFCPPCRTLEPYLEETLPELISSGVKVTFVDAAFNQQSSLYAHYFLYAANAASSLESFIHARSVLFELAENSGIESERELLQAMKEKNVDIKLLDTQPLMDQWKEIIEKHNLRSTPTCVIIKPGQDPEQHRGGKAIPKALDNLLDKVSQKQSKVSD
ncbi:MAG: DsbA family protein [Desulfobacterales bacterium]